ncbi:MAG: hypothetical protein ACRDRK_24905 [Pseudonocardia sp.]
MSTRNPDPARATTTASAAVLLNDITGGIGRAAGLMPFGRAKTIEASGDDLLRHHATPTGA